MKDLNWHAPLYGAGGTKKSLCTPLSKDGFFVPGVTLSVKPAPFILCLADVPTMAIPLINSSLGTSANHAAVGMRAGFMSLAQLCDPTAVFFPTRNLTLGGRFTGRNILHRNLPLTGRFLSFHHFVKEYIVILTDHVRRIERLTAQTLVHVQEENYQKVREDFDNIHVHTTAAQQQLEKLQWITPRVPGPEGD